MHLAIIYNTANSATSPHPNEWTIFKKNGYPDIKYLHSNKKFIPQIDGGEEMSEREAIEAAGWNI